MTRKRRKRRSGRKARQPPRRTTTAGASSRELPATSPRRHWRLLTLAAAVLLSTAALVVSSGVLSRREEGQEPAGADQSSIPRIPQVDGIAGLDPGMVAVIESAVDEVRKEPANAEAWGRLGQIYDAHMLHALAFECYAEASRLDPEDPAWHYYRAMIDKERGAVKRAMAGFENTIRLLPDYLPAYYRLGSLHLAVGDFDAARLAYGEIVARAPQWPWGHLGLGKVAWRQQQFELAASRLEQARQLGPDIREANYLLAMAHRALGHEELADELLEAVASARRLGMDDPLMRQMRRQRSDLRERIAVARQLKAAGRAEDALAIYRVVLSLDPEQFDAHQDLGILYAQTGRPEEAERHLERARSLRPESPEPLINLAVLHYQTGRLERSLSEVRQALRIDPGHAEAGRIFAALSAELSRSPGEDKSVDDGSQH